MPTIDLCASLLAFAALTAGAIAYAVRYQLYGAAHSARVNALGSSAMLGRGALEFGYWLLVPLGRACAWAEFTANQLTGLSLLLGLGAGIALAFGHVGIGALVAALAAIGDGLDGMVARASGSSSSSGALFDASTDRYTEFFLLAGLAFHERGNPLLLALALFAILGSFMISYGSAKAEGFRVLVPGGAMRRAERAIYLCGGLLLTPVTSWLAQRNLVPAQCAILPELLALGAVALVSNVVAQRRLRLIARAADAKANQATAPLHAVSAVMPEGPLASNELVGQSAVWVRTSAKRAS